MTGLKFHEAKGRRVNVLEVQTLMYLETSSSVFHELRAKQFKMTEVKNIYISRHSCILKDQNSWVSLSKLSSSENSIALCSYREWASAPETNRIFAREQFCFTERTHLLCTRNEADLRENYYHQKNKWISPSQKKISSIETDESIWWKEGYSSRTAFQYKHRRKSLSIFKEKVDWFQRIYKNFYSLNLW